MDKAGHRPGPLVIGLIGGMGSGKSQVAAELARRGARVISGDQLGHEALRQPEILPQVVQRWGPAVLDQNGRIDRQKLGAVVFADLHQRRALEALVFPWIGARMSEELTATKGACGLVVIDAAVMLEAGWDPNCDAIVYVHAPRSVRLKRLAEQRGWSEVEVNQRAQAQLSLTEKASRADFVLENSGDREQLGAQIDELLRQLSFPAPQSERVRAAANGNVKEKSTVTRL
jgi:dephospho-CoA kinase